MDKTVKFAIILGAIIPIIFLGVVLGVMLMDQLIQTLESLPFFPLSFLA